MKVRSYLALLILAALVPLVLFSAFVVQVMIASERLAVQQNMHELARTTILAVDQELVYAGATARAVSTSYRLRQEDFEGFYAQLKDVNAGRGIHGALLDETGQQVFNTAAPFGAPIRAPTPAVAERVRAVFRDSELKVSDLIIGSATKKYVVTVEFPVTVQSGRRYLVDEWMYASHLNKLLPKKDVPQSWLIAVFDRKGITVARNKGFEQFVGTAPREEVRTAMRQNVQSSVLTISREGVEVYTALARSPLTGWVAAVGVPSAEIEGKAVRAVGLIGAGLVVAILFAIAGGLLVSRRLVQSIGMVDAAAKALGQGAIPSPVELKVHEMNELQGSLTNVGLQLQQSDAARRSHLAEAHEARLVAERHSRAKDEFLAMLGHELRNPLAAITSAVTLQDMLPADAPGAARAREVIGRQTRQLSSLVDELLDAQRILTGKIKLNLSLVDVARAVRECADAHATQLRQAGHALDLDVEPAMVLADPTRIQQIVANLLDNAIKYTPSGGHIRMQLVSRDGWAVLSVSDSGIGMADDLRANVFELFVQGDVLNRQKGGLGIGLAVVKALAVQQGGSVLAESGGPGAGSTFIVRLPQAQSSAQEAPLPDETAVLPDAAVVLLVEDNADVRNMIAALLEARGIEVITAADGAQAVAAAANPRIGVALVDIDLPDMSGYEVATAILARRKMKLVAVTGYGQPRDREKALSSGFDMHLTKPVKVEELIKAIATLGEVPTA